MSLKFILKKIIRKLYHLISFLALFLLFSNNVNASTTGNLTVNRIRYYDISGNMYQTSNYGGFNTSNLINNMYIYFKANSQTGITGKYAIFSGFTKTTQVVSNQPVSFSLVPVSLMNGSLDNSNSCFMSKSETNNMLDGDFSNNYISFVIACKLDYALNGSNDSNIIHFSTVSVGNQVFTTYLNDRFYITDDPYSNKGQEIINSIAESNQKLTETNEKLDDLNDNITNEDEPSVDLSDVDTISTTPISDLITLPATLLNSYLTAFSGSCTNYVLPLPFNHSITLPCFTIGDYVGSAVANIIDMAICLFMAYEIVLLFIRIFDDITTLSDTYTNWVKRGRY